MSYYQNMNTGHITTNPCGPVESLRFTDGDIKLKKHTKWTDEEKRFLFENHKTMSLSELANHIGVNERTMKTQLGRQGLSYYRGK